ncbi:MAG: resolvase [Nitrospirales bacterium]|nr:MAG: resolvase [Nitrospirales bacterium]
MKAHTMEEKRKNAKAVIYCRVSSSAQVKKGDGLGSQETRCREFARHKGFGVETVFHDEGASGGIIDRPGMQSMLTFLKRQKKQEYFVIIDDISRLARGIDAHIQLRTSIGAAGGTLVSPSIEFGEDSDSILVENLLASVSQHQRQKNAEQTKNRMQARVRNGYWPFSPVVGYRYDSVPGHVGRMLVPDEPVASVVKEALESYASGRFDSQSEVKRFLERSAHFPKNKDGEVVYQRVDDLLNRVLYAGYLDVPKWGLSLHPAKHEPLISYETYQAIQKRMRGQAKAPARKDLTQDFPLRGFVTCGACGHPMTACWSTGTGGKYPYYHCHSKGCIDYRKSIRKEKMEEEFEKLLLQMRPSRNLFFVASTMFQELWTQRQAMAQQDGVSLKSEIRQIERKVDQYLDRIIATEQTSVITAYENQINKLEEQKVALTEKVNNCGRPLQPFDETFRTAMTFLANPQKLWSSDRIEDKRAVLRMVFAEKLPYRRNEGFRTAQTSLPFTLLQGLEGGQYDVARPERLELPTLGSEDRCSIH